jgi:hypothetical protein
MNGQSANAGPATNPSLQPDWYAREIPPFLPGRSDVAASYLALLPESLRLELTLALDQLDALGSSSISADTKVALIAALNNGHHFDEIRKFLNYLRSVLKKICEQNTFLQEMAANKAFSIAGPPAPVMAIDNEAIARNILSALTDKKSLMMINFDNILQLLVFNQHHTETLVNSMNGLHHRLATLERRAKFTPWIIMVILIISQLLVRCIV